MKEMSPKAHSLHKTVIGVLIVVIIFQAVVGAWQYRQIRVLEGRLQEAEQELNSQKGQIAYLNETVKGSAFAQVCSEESYDYLAIGNSITFHEICDYWWAEYGMAASNPENDYYHRVVEQLRAVEPELNTAVCSFAVWEMQSTDRSETLQLLDSYLSEYLDLITVQLSENVQNMDTFERDFAYLLHYIQKRCPTAQILVIGDFWSVEKNKIKENICLQDGIVFVDLTQIVDQEAYMANMGSPVFGADGETYAIDHEGVARHPNDIGMEYIANRIIASINHVN